MGPGRPGKGAPLLVGSAGSAPFGVDLRGPCPLGQGRDLPPLEDRRRHILFTRSTPLLPRARQPFDFSASLSSSRIAWLWALIRRVTVPMVKSPTPVIDTGRETPSTAMASGQSRSSAQ